MRKDYSMLISGVVFLALLIVILNYSGLLVLPLASISTGIFLLGLGLPETIKKTSYSHTIWLPAVVIVAGIIGLFLVFGGAAFQILSSFNWCYRQPCYPFGLFFISFVLGNIANWVGYFLAEEKLDLLGGE